MTAATVHALVLKVDVRGQMRDQMRNPDLPAWCRVWAWAWAHADTTGHANATAMQIRKQCRIRHASQVSVAIADCRARGLLDPTSTAQCLVLPGHATAPCTAEHRGT